MRKNQSTGDHKKGKPPRKKQKLQTPSARRQDGGPSPTNTFSLNTPTTTSQYTSHSSGMPHVIYGLPTDVGVRASTKDTYVRGQPNLSSSGTSLRQDHLPIVSEGGTDQSTAESSTADIDLWQDILGFPPGETQISMPHFFYPPSTMPPLLNGGSKIDTPHELHSFHLGSSSIRPIHANLSSFNGDSLSGHQSGDPHGRALPIDDYGFYNDMPSMAIGNEQSSMQTDDDLFSTQLGHNLPLVPSWSEWDVSRYFDQLVDEASPHVAASLLPMLDGSDDEADDEADEASNDGSLEWTRYQTPFGYFHPDKKKRSNQGPHDFPHVGKRVVVDEARKANPRYDWRYFRNRRTGMAPSAGQARKFIRRIEKETRTPLPAETKRSYDKLYKKRRAELDKAKTNREAFVALNKLNEFSPFTTYGIGRIANKEQLKGKGENKKTVSGMVNTLKSWLKDFVRPFLDKADPNAVIVDPKNQNKLLRDLGTVARGEYPSEADTSSDPEYD